MVIKDTPYVFITHNVTTDILLINWRRSPSVKQLKDAYSAALQYVQDVCLVTSFCTDLTAIGPLTREQEAWLMQEYYPNVFTSINTSIIAAVVFSDEHFKAIVTNYQQPDYILGQEFIQFNYFTSFQEAMHWLVYTKKGQEILRS